MGRAMKDSGIEWIGEIPEGWQTKKAKYCVSISHGTDPTMEGDTPVYGSGAKNFKTCGEYKEGPCVLIGRKGATLHIPHYIVGKYWNVDTAFDCKRIGTYNLKYYYYCACSFDYQFYITQTTLPGMTQSAYNNMRLPAPDENEQIRIAAILDAKCAKIDSIIEQVQSSIEEYKHLKQAVITQAVTKGVRGDRPMKESGIAWVDQIPQEIQITRVGMLFEIILGKMLCSTQVDNSYTLAPYYCAADVHFDGISTVTERKQMWFSPAEKDMYLVKPGDLLVVEGGAGAGGCAIVVNQSEPTYIQNSIMIVRPKGCVCVQYLRYWIEFLVKQGYIDVVCNKATIPHFTKDKLAAVPIPAFPAEESEEIAIYLDETCAKIDALIAKKEQLLTELEGYKKSLIYEYVTGKKEVAP